MSTWAVVPVKRFGLAKQRLAGCLAPAERAALAQLMLEHVLDTLAATRGLGGVLVVSADEQARMRARDHGFTVLDEPTPGGMDAAVRCAAGWLCRRRIASMLVLPSDLPAITPLDIQALLRAHADAPAATIAPSRDGDGTNAMLLTPPHALAPAYGVGSCARHIAAAREGGLRLRRLERWALALDIDLPSDLEHLLQHGAPAAMHRLWQQRTPTAELTQA
jgi:2-phospho-L-lactate guanylyltransferase